MAFGRGKTLIVHWNGKTWKRVSSQTYPDPGLFILHGDGHAWTRAPSPQMAPGERWLGAVASLPSNRAWAVGLNDGGLISRTWHDLAG